MKKKIFLILVFILSSCSLPDYLFNDSILWLRVPQNVKIVDQDVSLRKNIHPVKIPPDRVQGAFRLILVRYGKDIIQLFSEEKIDIISQAVSDGLLRANSNEDIVFTLEDWYKGKYTKDNLVTSGRIFYNKDGLNVIFGSILRKGFQSETDPMVKTALNPDLRKNPYVPGSRKISIKNRYYLSAPPNSGVFRPKGAKGRADWLVFTTKSLKPRSSLNRNTREIATRSNIEVQSLSSEVKQLRRELNQIKRGPTNQNYKRSYNQNIQNEIKALQSMRAKGIISEEEFKKRIRQLGY